MSMLEVFLWWMPSVGNLGYPGMCDVARKKSAQDQTLEGRGLDFLIIIIFIFNEAP